MGDSMCDKDEVCKDCYYEERSYAVDPCKECSRAFSGMQKDWYAGKEEPEYKKTASWIIGQHERKMRELEREKNYLTKLIDDHWAYIEKLIDVTQMHSNPKEKAIAEFHYRSAAVHFWKHCREWMEGK